jgi:hypothetical protein
MGVSGHSTHLHRQLGAGHCALAGHEEGALVGREIGRGMQLYQSCML